MTDTAVRLRLHPLSPGRWPDGDRLTYGGTVKAGTLTLDPVLTGGDRYRVVLARVVPSRLRTAGRMFAYSPWWTARERLRAVTFGTRWVVTVNDHGRSVGQRHATTRAGALRQARRVVAADRRH